MKRTVCCAIAICLLSLFSANAFGYLGKSIRIMSIGNYLAGVVRDQDTDIYRNPAYLSFVDKVRVFGQYNLYGHTELQIAPAFTNKGTGLLGLALPTTGYGNLALVCELKPSTSKNKSGYTIRTDGVDDYSVRSDSKQNSQKKSIEGFKVVYGVRLSPSVRVGADLSYFRNYNRLESQSTSTFTVRALDSEDITYYDEQLETQNSDDSPDAQRVSAGMVLNPWSKTTLDLALYYENLSYTKTASSRDDFYTEDLLTDTATTVHLHHTASSGPTKNWAGGLDLNLRRQFPQSTSLVLLLGLRYGESDFSWSEHEKDTSYYSWKDNHSWIGHSASVAYDDKAFSLTLGMGVEKDFSTSIKVATACRGYWVREKLDRHRQDCSWTIWAIDDSVAHKKTSSEASQTKKTANSYELAFPIGAEIVLHKMVKVRLGGAFVIARDETETGYSTSSNGYYSQGAGFSYDDRIFLDADIRNETDRLGNWMVKVEYRF